MDPDEQLYSVYEVGTLGVGARVETLRCWDMTYADACYQARAQIADMRNAVIREQLHRRLPAAPAENGSEERR